MALESAVWSRDPPIRLFIGVSIGRRSGRLKTAAIRGRGEGWNLRTLAVDAVTMPPPQPDLRSLAKQVVASIRSLVLQIGASLSEVDCLGLDTISGTQSAGMLAATVAEQTGITVINGFADSDRACGGRGEPLSPVPDWFLHRSNKHGRMLVHLGPTMWISVFTAGATAEQVMCFDAGPCCEFLDGLAADLSQGRYPFDPNGHFAVQGRTCRELVSKWSSHPYLLQPPPKLLDGQEFGYEFRQTSLSFARDQKLSARDVLCSANQFIVRNLAEAIDRMHKRKLRVDELVVTGGGVRNRMLWRLLTAQVAPMPVRLADKAGVPSEACRAAHCALLAYCAMENLCGNVVALTGAKTERVLGQVTPGSPQNWDRWVCNLADRFDLAAGRAA